MTTNRRTFLQETLLSGGLAGMIGADLKGHDLSERLLTFAAQVAPGDAGTGKHDSKSFWDNFGAAADPNGAAPGGVHGRGLIRKSAADTGSGDLDRQIDFFHYTKDKRLQFANTSKRRTCWIMSAILRPV
jgi:hypothetical protein